MTARALRGYIANGMSEAEAQEAWKQAISAAKREGAEATCSCGTKRWLAPFRLAELGKRPYRCAKCFRKETAVVRTCENCGGPRSKKSKRYCAACGATPALTIEWMGDPYSLRELVALAGVTPGSVRDRLRNGQDPVTGRDLTTGKKPKGGRPKRQPPE